MAFSHNVCEIWRKYFLRLSPTDTNRVCEVHAFNEADLSGLTRKLAEPRRHIPKGIPLVMGDGIGIHVEFMAQITSCDFTKHITRKKVE